MHIPGLRLVPARLVPGRLVRRGHPQDPGGRVRAHAQLHHEANDGGG